jgi:CRP-like cAMP-binding protein
MSLIRKIHSKADRAFGHLPVTSRTGLLRHTSGVAAMKFYTWVLAAVGGSMSLAVLVMNLRADEPKLTSSLAFLGIAIPLFGWTATMTRLIGEGSVVIQSAGEPSLGSPHTPSPLSLVAMAGSYHSGGPSRSAARRERTTTSTFWDALNPTEQEALLSVARRRTFSRGATLFREGEFADHVVVIWSGWTKISVREENGQERVLAERGPGQLIGERAALQVNERSATVVALDTVDALVLDTPDFADFISAHPHVLSIVEGQIYRRLRESSGQHPYTGGRVTAETRPADAPYDESSPAGRPRLDGHLCMILRTDIVGYGARIRTAGDRVLIQQRSLAMTRHAFVCAGLPWDRCHRRDQGDGQLLVIPATIPPRLVVGALAWLAAELKAYNRRVTAPVQIRLRASMHMGPVTINDDAGMSGEALMLSARLLEAPKLKRSMAETGAPLGAIASGHFYDNVIKDLDVEEYQKIRCTVKETRVEGWMCLITPALPPCPPMG